MTAPVPAIRALLWELTARHRTALLLTMFGAPLALFALHAWIEDRPQLTAWLGTAHLMAGWCVVYVAMIFAYASFSTKTLVTGFPTHVLKLPVKTRLLVLLPFAAAVAAVTTVTVLLLLAAGIRLALPLDLLALLLAGAAAMSWLQAINWGLSRTPVRAGALLIIVFGLGGVSVLSVLSFSPAPLLPSPGMALLTLAGMGAAGLAAAWLAVARERRGETTGRLIVWGDLTVPGFRMRRRLRTPAAGQFWYEWRVFGWVFPVSALFFGALLFAAQFLPADAMDRVEASLLVLMMFLYVAGMLGHELAKSHFGAPDHTLSPFLATRPLSTVALAHAKLKVATVSVLVGSVICLVALAPGWQMAGHGAALAAGWTRAVTTHGHVGAPFLMVAAALLVPATGWALTGNVLALMLGGRGSRWAWRIGGVVLMVLFVAVMAFDEQASAVGHWLLEHILWVGAVAIGGGLALLLATLSRFRQIGNLGHLRGVGSVAAAAVLTLVIGFQALALPELIQDGLSQLAMILAIACVLPWIYGPVMLARNRHG